MVPTMKLSKRVKVLIAAVQLEERGILPFSGQHLVMEAWKRYPKTFGLKGYTDEHPCSQSLIWMLCGEKSIVKKGLLGKVGENKYILTPTGREFAYRMAAYHGEVLGRQAPTPLPNNGISREANAFLDRVIHSQAFAKALSLEDNTITFADAMEMWGLSQFEKGELINIRLEEFEQELKNVDTLLRGMRGEIVLKDGRSVTWSDMATITTLDKTLRRQCHVHLRLLEERK